MADDHLEGVAVLAAWGDSFQHAAHEINARCAEVEEQVAPLRAAVRDTPPAPWHIVSADLYAQRITLTSGTLALSDGRRTGRLEDLRTLFLRPLLSGQSGTRLRFIAALESAARGSHDIIVRVGRKQTTRYRIDLLTEKVTRALARVRRPDA